MEPKS